MEKLIRIHPLDNVLIAIKEICEGESLNVDGKLIFFDKPIVIGHKIAGQFIAAKDKIIKYGVPIGSALVDIVTGMHVHLHNMKSDYIPTYTVDSAYNENPNLAGQ
jgi:altronate dehydratase small subunit